MVLGIGETDRNAVPLCHESIVKTKSIEVSSLRSASGVFQIDDESVTEIEVDDGRQSCIRY